MRLGGFLLRLVLTSSFGFGVGRDRLGTIDTIIQTTNLMPSPLGQSVTPI